MSVETYAEREHTRLGMRLFALYGRWTALYLLAVLALWLLGIEAIYEHPTPFYAFLKPAFTNFTTPSILVAALWLAWLVAVNAAGRHERPRWRMALSFLPWALFAVAVAVSTVLQAFNPGALRQVWLDLRWHLLAAAVFAAAAGGLLAALRHLRGFEEEPSPRATAWLLVALVFFAFASSGAIAMLRDGADGITDAYSRYKYEYISDIGFGGTLRGLFAEYLDKHEFLSMHGKVHPPGPIVILWLLTYVAGREALGLSLATMAVGSLAVVPLYFWAKDLLGKRAALTASLVYVCIPTVVLFTATSADILFMPFTLLTLFLFGRAIEKPSVPYAIAAGLMYAVISLLSFSLLAVGAWFGFFGLWRLLDPRRRMAVFQTAVVMFASFLALHIAVWLWSGFDVFGAFHAAKAQFDEDQVGVDLYMPRYPSWAWKFLNPLAWLYFAGIPVSVLFVWRLTRPNGAPRALFVVLALTLLVLDLLYLARGEGERSAMYIIPFVLLPAAHALESMRSKSHSTAPLVATVVFLAFQCWLTESLFYTYW